MGTERVNLNPLHHIASYERDRETKARTRVLEYDAHRTDRKTDGQAFLSPGLLEGWIRSNSSR